MLTAPECRHTSERPPEKTMLDLGPERGTLISFLPSYTLRGGGS
jgi:hypothetical protein